MPPLRSTQHQASEQIGLLQARDPMVLPMQYLLDRFGRFDRQLPIQAVGRRP
jgi:hypothetical protein